MDKRMRRRSGVGKEGLRERDKTSIRSELRKSVGKFGERERESRSVADLGNVKGS